MHRLAVPIATFFFLLNLAAGLRGLWQEDKSLFSQHPFSDPISVCEVRAEQHGIHVPLPLPLYRSIPSESFTERLYLELLPSHRTAIETVLLNEYPDVTVSASCTPLHSPYSSNI